jgi:hypothetical protein
MSGIMNTRNSASRFRLLGLDAFIVYAIVYKRLLLSLKRVSNKPEIAKRVNCWLWADWALPVLPSVCSVLLPVRLQMTSSCLPYRIGECQVCIATCLYDARLRDSMRDMDTLVSYLLNWRLTRSRRQRSS